MPFKLDTFTENAISDVESRCDARQELRIKLGDWKLKLIAKLAFGLMSDVRVSVLLLEGIDLLPEGLNFDVDRFDELLRKAALTYELLRRVK